MHKPKSSEPVLPGKDPPAMTEDGSSDEEGIKLLMPIVRATLPGDDDESESRGDVTEGKPEKYINTINRTEFETLPYPITVDSAAVESVFPEKRCPQAAIHKPEGAVTSYTAANETKIKDAGPKLAPC